MTDLPEDVHRWPHNPYQLLDIPYGSDQRVIRQAYTRLIRRFQPEFFPEQFRRIHKAYTELRQSGRLVEPPPIGTLDQDLPFEASHGCRGPATTGGPFAIPLESTVESIWETAIQDPRVAYTELIDRCRSPMCLADEFIAMYWICRICPEVAPDSLALDWLIKGMRRTHHHEDLMRLYRRHVQWFPQDALSEELHDFILNSPKQHVVSELLRSRWTAAYHFGQPSIIEVDMSTLRTSLEVVEPDLWLHLLMDAAKRLLMFGDALNRKLGQSFIAEAQELGGTDSTRFDALSELDTVLEVNQSWHELQTGDDPIVQSLSELVPYCWMPDMAGQQLAVRKWITVCQADPSVALCQLTSSRPIDDMLFSHVEELLLQEYPQLRTLTSRPISDDHKSIIVDFLCSVTDGDWNFLRLSVLEFCIMFGLPPQAISSGLDATETNAIFSNNVQEDLILQLVWLTSMCGLAN